MKHEKANASISLPIWGVALVLAALLYLMYSSSFTFEYLMMDEVDKIGRSRNLLDLAYRNYFRNGRFLHGIYKALVFNFAGYDPLKVQFVRFVNFASIAVVALLLFRFLRLQSKNIALAFFTILFFFSQLPFQGAVGYGLHNMTQDLPSLLLSLLAFYLHFYWFPKRKAPKWIAYGAVFVIFMAAMQSTQTHAYFAMVPLSFLVLTEGKERKQQILSFFTLALASLILSALVYKLGLEILHGLGKHGYGRAERAVAALTTSPLKVLLMALNPATYWSAFKVWTYPYPFHYTLPLGDLKQNLAMTVMAAWGCLTGAALGRELFTSPPGEKREVLLKWFWVLVCLGFGALMIIADTPLKIRDHRPHFTMTFVGVCIFMGAYALQVLSSSYRIFRTAFLKGIGILLVVLTAFGAQSGLQRGIVDRRQDELDFIRTELSAKSPDEYKKIVVVKSSSNQCITEPCGIWFGRILRRSHASSKGMHKYALHTLGIPPESKEILYVKRRPEQVAEDELIIDWTKYVRAHEWHRNYLRKGRRSSRFMTRARIYNWN